MTDKHERSGDFRAIKQGMEVRRDVDPILRERRGFAPASPGTILDTHLCILYDRRLDPSPVRRSLAEARLEYHRWTALGDVHLATFLASCGHGYLRVADEYVEEIVIVVSRR
jgi:hypothetical protein